MYLLLSSLVLLAFAMRKYYSMVNFGAKPFSKFAASFNGIYTVFAPLPFIELTDFEMIREAYLEKGDNFVDRPHAPGIDDVFNYIPNGGVIHSSGESWREQRRAALQILRDFGMGKNVMEELVRNSIVEYLKCLKSLENKEEVNMRWPIQLMVANVINEVLFGYRYKYDDCKGLVNYVDDFSFMLQEVAKSKLLPLALAFPAIRHVPFIGYHALIVHKDRVTELNRYVAGNVREVMESYDADSEPTNFVHAYMQKMRNSTFLTEDQLIATCSDFFSAGQETTTTTLRWAVLYLAAHQHVQEKLRSEIHRVIGRDTLPSLSDKPQLIYAQATVHELQRAANLLRMNMLRTATMDTTIGGHFIPAGSLIHADIHCVMERDPVFERPHEFRPERYIDEDGKSLRKDLLERTIPFSIGKRACAGEGLARVELFLGLVATVQHYRILPVGNAPIDLTPIPQNFAIPKDQGVRFERV